MKLDGNIEVRRGCLVAKHALDELVDRHGPLPVEVEGLEELLDGEDHVHLGHELHDACPGILFEGPTGPKGKAQGSGRVHRSSLPACQFFGEVCKVLQCMYV